MQQELQLTLFIIGVIAIAGVLLHGLWKIRKSSANAKRRHFENRNWQPGFEQEDSLSSDEPLYDDVGVGKARVVLNPLKDDTEELDEPIVAEPVVADHNIKTDEFHLNIDEVNTQQATNDEFELLSSSSESDSISSDNSELDKQLDKQLDEKQSPDESPNITTNKPSITPASTAAITLPLAADTENPYPEKADAEDLASSIDQIESGDLRANASQQDNSPASQETDNIHSNSASVNEDLLGSPPEHVTDATENLSLVETDKSNAPVYSNVVTQPKPEYSKPQYTRDTSKNIDSQPPAFLLKKGAKANEPSPAELGDAASTKVGNVSETKAINSEQIKTDATPKHADEAKVSAPEPDFSLNIQEGPKTNEKKEANKEKDLSFAEQAKRFVKRNKKTVADKIRKDPVLKAKQNSDQMRIDFDESHGESIDKKAEQASSLASNENKQKSSKTSAETDVLVLNVRASDDNPIEGAALLPMLLTLGFKFGEHDIFHRHVNTNGKGPILFSLTNMFKPGVFDIDNIENFNTYGVSLFMMLPIEGDAQQVFNMMHNAARKISEEFSCRILDGNKVGLSKQSLQQYIERIREFERKRITQ